MLEVPAATPPPAPETRPVFSRGTLIALGLWAWVFVVFTVLGLQP
jgi:hypothetical protein